MNDQLKAYLDNALSTDERTKVEAELNINPALQKELEVLTATSHYLEASAAPIEIQGLESTLAALTQKRAKLPWFRSPYAVLAASTIFVALVMPVVFPVFAQTKNPSSEFANAEVAASSPMAKSADSSTTDTVAPSSYVPALKSDPEAGGSAGAELDRQRSESESAPGNSVARDEQSYINESLEEKVQDPKKSTTQSVPNNRQIIKTADLAIRVKDIISTSSRAEVTAKQYGGYVETSSRYIQGNSKYANYVLRVKSDQFDKALDAIRKLGEVTRESTSGEDVTGQIADTSARLKQKRLEEAQYQEVLKSARRISDILEVKQYISDIREEIEATEAQLKSLKNLASLSTISLNLEQREAIKPPPPRDWLSNAWIKAVNRFSGIGQYLVGAAINILVLSPFWLPFAIGIWWWNRKRSR